VARPSDALSEVAAILAAGYLRLLLSKTQGAATGAHPRACGTADSQPQRQTAVDLTAKESAHCGGERTRRQRAVGRPGRAPGRDPDVEDGPAPGGADPAGGDAGQVLESTVPGPEGELAHPSGHASGVRRRRSSDTRDRSPEPAPKRSAGCTNPGPPVTRSRSQATTTGHGTSSRLPQAQTHGNGPRPRI